MPTHDDQRRRAGFVGARASAGHGRRQDHVVRRTVPERSSRLSAARKKKTSPAWCRAGAKLVEVFSADLRSLATFRVVLALVVLTDLAIRATDLAAHYSG